MNNNKEDENSGFVAIFIGILLYLVIMSLLSGCSPKESTKTASIRTIDSTADAGALAIYRHNAKMNELASQMKMIHPIETRKEGNKK